MEFIPLDIEQEKILSESELEKYKKDKKIYELFHNTQDVIDDIINSACPIFPYTFNLTFIPRDQKTYKSYGSPNLINSCVSELSIDIKNI